MPIGIAANTGSNAMQTTGTLTLKPFSAGTNMSLAGTSAFDLTAAAVADIAGGVGPAGAIVIGDAAASTGAMTIGGAVNFGVRTVTLNAGSFTDGNSASRISARDLNLNARTGAIGAAGGNNAIDVTTTNLTFNTDNQDAFINASGAVNLGGGTSATGNGNIDLSAGGALTQSPGGAIASSGGTVLAAGAANDITLNAANDFGTVVVANGRNVTLNDTNALDLGASTLSGNLQATTAGALTQSGAIVANGAGKAATFSAGNGNDITLAGANDFTSVAVGSARNATLHDSNALALGASTVTGAFVATAGGSVTLNGVINAGGAGNAIVLAAAGNFVNNAGAAALVPGSGRWLVYSSDPAADTRGGLLYDFKQYDATYGATPVLGTGDGMLYSLAPTLAVSLGGAVDKVYSGTTAATLGSRELRPQRDHRRGHGHSQQSGDGHLRDEERGQRHRCERRRRRGCEQYQRRPPGVWLSAGELDRQRQHREHHRRTAHGDRADGHPRVRQHDRVGGGAGGGGRRSTTR